MLRIDRGRLQNLKEHIAICMATATNASGLHIATPMPEDEHLEKAALLAMQSLTMDMFGAHDVAIPSDVTHFVGSNSLATTALGEK